jgi:hypothetical protein
MKVFVIVNDNLYGGTNNIEVFGNRERAEDAVCTQRDGLKWIVVEKECDYNEVIWIIIFDDCYAGGDDNIYVFSSYIDAQFHKNSLNNRREYKILGRQIR